MRTFHQNVGLYENAWKIWNTAKQSIELESGLLSSQSYVNSNWSVCVCKLQKQAVWLRNRLQSETDILIELQVTVLTESSLSYHTLHPCHDIIWRCSFAHWPTSKCTSLSKCVHLTKFSCLSLSLKYSKLRGQYRGIWVGTNIPTALNVSVCIWV